MYKTPKSYDSESIYILLKYYNNLIILDTASILRKRMKILDKKYLGSTDPFNTQKLPFLTHYQTHPICTASVYPYHNLLLVFTLILLLCRGGSLLTPLTYKWVDPGFV